MTTMSCNYRLVKLDCSVLTVQLSDNAPPHGLSRSPPLTRYSRIVANSGALCSMQVKRRVGIVGGGG